MNLAAPTLTTDDLPLSESERIACSAKSWGGLKPDIIYGSPDLISEGTTTKERVLFKGGRRVKRRRTLRYDCFICPDDPDSEL
ncbi:hypothetical protein N7471_005390 [Penicillium samsonianum]|uniref:uncharacterized protein n=1 Tax=Penicillium samsonianum TaxID=1882272 RepID=UPI00254977ED|nr:uncharacterized protein N7471_005390 [Penicillium samsonianum]KAJ6138904.1 hypothetical protein N7471_005390 [Penicillium samsonianum]